MRVDSHAEGPVVASSAINSRATTVRTAASAGTGDNAVRIQAARSLARRQRVQGYQACGRHTRLSFGDVVPRLCSRRDIATMVCNTKMPRA